MNVSLNFDNTIEKVRLERSGTGVISHKKEGKFFIKIK